MANRWEKMETVIDFIFLGSKITTDSDCSHEIKICLLHGRKAMTNLDSVLRIRDIILLTKVCIVQAMVFPVVMYGRESWTIKKAECWRMNAFELWCWRRLLRVPWTARRSKQSILKEINPEHSLEGLMLKHAPILWPSDVKSRLFGKHWCWWKLSAGEGDDRGWDGWVGSLTWWTWVWVSFRSWWWTEKPGVLQSMGSQESGTTEQLNWLTENQGCGHGDGVFRK